MEKEVIYSEEIEKIVNQENTECALYHSRECRMLNAKNCDECKTGKLSREKQEKTKAALSRLYDAAPPERVAELYTDEECKFCKTETKGKRECYGLFDLSKRDEEGDWTIALGKRRVGLKGADMILPLQVSSCKECRKRHRLFAYLPTFTALVIAALGLFLTTATGLYKTLYDIAAWMPALTMAIFALIAIATYYIMSGVMAGSFSKKTRMNVEEIPEVKAFMDEGFKEVAEKKHGVSTVVFSSKFREHGVGSWLPSEEEPEPPVCPGGEEEPHLMGIRPVEVPGEEPSKEDE